MIERQRVQSVGIHEPEVSVVVDEAGAEHLHYFIVSARRVALEEGVRLSGRTHAADYVRTGRVLFRHLYYGVHVVLKVCIY